MKMCKLALYALITTALGAGSSLAQEPPKPGKEHEFLKKLEGTWDCKVKVAGMESKGTMVYKMELGGMWLVGNFESEMFGQKFTGKGMDTYDPMKKKFVSLWIDSMSTSPMTFEGNYDKEMKKSTMVAEGIGMDGKPAKFKSVSTIKDDDNMTFSMFQLDGDKENEMITIEYKRRK